MEKKNNTLTEVSDKLSDKDLSDYLQKSPIYIKSYHKTKEVFESIEKKRKILKFINEQIERYEAILQYPLEVLCSKDLYDLRLTLELLYLDKEQFENELSIGKYSQLNTSTTSLLRETKNRKPPLEYYGNCIEGNGFNFILANTGYGKTTLATQMDTLLGGGRPHFKNHDLPVDDGVLEEKCKDRLILKYDLEQSEHAMLAIFNDRTGRNPHDSIDYTKGSLTITRENLWQIQKEGEKPLYQILIESIEYHMNAPQNRKKEIVVIIDNLTKLIEGELASERDIKPAIVALENLYLKANSKKKKNSS